MAAKNTGGAKTAQNLLRSDRPKHPDVSSVGEKVKNETGLSDVKTIT